ncbi:MAG: hypothetical protein BWX99_01157 [Deltaproteobacteria bacterium ADurb.Bin151]|nr:MAG: hypothetical protein BWX99_01157 [Deltaproteobacteria bacterium ADurb.Bin151]
MCYKIGLFYLLLTVLLTVHCRQKKTKEREYETSDYH